MNNIDERKNIINSIKSVYGEPKKGLDKRISFLKGINIINGSLTLIIWSILLSSIITTTFGIDNNYKLFQWERMDLLSILGLSFILNLPNALYELKLLNHYKKISKFNEIEGIQNLNMDLKNLLVKINFRPQNWFVLSLGVLILFMGLWKMYTEINNPYWIYVKIPILLFFGIIVFNYLKINQQLEQNIKQAEYNISPESKN